MSRLQIDDWTMPVLAVALAAVFASTATATQLASPESQPALISLSGRCENNGASYRYEPTRFRYPWSPPKSGYVVEFSTDAGPGDFRVDSADYAGVHGGADRSWHYIRDSNNYFEGGVGCYDGQSAFSWQLRAFPLPIAPTTYKGSATYSSFFYAGEQKFDQSLPFIAPAAGSYVARVALEQGSLTTETPDRQEHVLASTTDISLGVVQKGVSGLVIWPRDGPTAKYAITFSPIPGRLEHVGWTRFAIRPADIVRASYTVTSDAKVDAGVISSSGARVRTLANDLPVGLGTRTLTWDGLHGNGKSVPDGVYRLQLNTVDFFGNQAKASAPITVDATPPTLRLLSRSTLGQRDGLVIEVVDRSSGVASGSISVDGKRLMRIRQNQRKYVVVAHGGWRRGTHALGVRVVDRAGNIRVHRSLFWIQ